MQCEINAAKALMREETLRADSAEMRELTKNLAVVKTKIFVLNEEIKSLPPAYREPLSCLFAEAKEYMESLRTRRNAVVGRRHS